MQQLQLHGEMLAFVRMQARPEAPSGVNFLDPRAKRFRAADRSLQQARSALQGVQLVLSDMPRSDSSPVTSALDAVARALDAIEDAAGQIDEARLTAAADDG